MFCRMASLLNYLNNIQYVFIKYQYDMDQYLFCKTYFYIFEKFDMIH